MVRQSVYNAVWRWHFYAGLLVMPFMVLLAITGGLYLFQPQLTKAIYHNWAVVPQVALPLSLDEQARRVAASLQARVLQVTPPTAPNRATLFTVRTPDGRSRWAFVNPANGQVIGTTRYGGVMQLIRKLHSLQYFGFWPSCLIEISAGWAIILTGSGIYLWWPRGRSGGVVNIRSHPVRRVFWRDLHAVTGVFAAAIILFLAITGMPWSLVWGNTVQGWATRAGLGDPTPPAQAVPSWQLTQDLPWAVQRITAPNSGDGAGRSQIGLDRAFAAFRATGVQTPITITLPQSPRGAYVGESTLTRVENLRTIYLDQFNGHELGEIRFRDLGAVSKVIQWGVQTHLGLEYGPLNIALMLTGCVAILLLAVSSFVMWWKRRPQGKLGVPPQPAERRFARAVLFAIIPVAVIYPLVGASLLVALAVDAVWVWTQTPSLTPHPPNIH